jgi:hypothetical protein
LIHAQCQNCGTFDIIGPGHPAGETDPVTGLFTWTDRAALRHSHADDCQPGDDGNYPLHITLLGGVGVTGAS